MLVSPCHASYALKLHQISIFKFCYTPRSNEEPNMNAIFFSQANESGIIQFIKRPGAVLENGSIIAKLALDDPAQCCRVEQYQGPGFDSLRFSDSKLPLDLHQNYLKTKQILENSLDGYCPGDEKFFKEYIGAISNH